MRVVVIMIGRLMPQNELAKVIQTLVGQSQEAQPQPPSAGPTDLDEGRNVVVLRQAEFQPDNLAGGDVGFTFQADTAQADIVDHDGLVLPFEFFHGGGGPRGIHLPDDGLQAAGDSGMATVFEDGGH